MAYFPIYLELAGRRCLVIGGGAVAERKIAGLLEAGADVTVVSPEVSSVIAGWAKEQAIEVKLRPYRSGDLDGFQLAFVATDEPAVSGQVFEAGKERGVWVNAADDPDYCDFILPSVLRRGDLTVAVSSGGKSPALARLIREELETYFTKEYEQLAALAAEARIELQRRSLSAPFEAWKRALSGEVRQLLGRGEIGRAKSRLLQELGVSP